MAARIPDSKFQIPNSPLRILGLETSCDETSLAILEVESLKSKVESRIRLKRHETISQIPIHQRYGGVVPEVAARSHVPEVVSLLERAKVFKRDSFDAIAVTRGPGLATALRVGIEGARTLAFLSGKPIVGVNHLEGHLASAWLVPKNRRNWKFPILFLLVSGGHTELVLMRDFCVYEVLGRTRDDASGEAFDKTAKLMGLPYPGGPEISRRAAQGQAGKFKLPRPMLNDASLDFSFSGLKSAVRRVWDDLPASKKTSSINDLCAAVEEAIVEVLVSKTLRAAQRFKPRAVGVVGGVSANPALQTGLKRALTALGVKFLEPPRGFYTDNGAMIAAAGLWQLRRNGLKGSWRGLEAEPELDL